HRADRLLDGRVHVDAMLVVEVDVVDAEALQGGVDCLAHVLRCAVDRPAAVVEPTVAELRRDHIVVAPTGDRLADELLVRALAVDVGGVEKVDPELARAMDRRDGLLVVSRAVPRGHAHAAQTLRRDLKPGAERAPLHARRLLLRAGGTSRCPQIPSTGPSCARTGRFAAATLPRSWPSPRRKPPRRAATSAARSMGSR